MNRRHKTSHSLLNHNVVAAGSMIGVRMLHGALVVGVLNTAAVGADAPAPKAGTVSAEPIATQYRLYCSGCHGETGEGNGNLAYASDKKPADLTTLSARNNGVFPHEFVLRVIDGRDDVKEHGPRDMPVWGEWFKFEAGEGLGGAEGNETIVRQRIEAMTEYLATLQKK